MTDLVVSEGYAAVGYEYINVDDCWLEKNRGSNNELVADRRRFPSGMKSLADYVTRYLMKNDFVMFLMRSTFLGS
jgi:alpha-N-acetylgalactosaminidase